MYLDKLSAHFHSLSVSYLDRIHTRTGRAVQYLTDDNIRSARLVLEQASRDLHKACEALEGLEQVRDVQGLIDLGI